MLALGAVSAAHATPIISEFMASNNSTLADQDGDYADWVEIYNPDTVADNLQGWYLTNSATALTKWTIPAVTLQPGTSIVIFCSGKNYTAPASPLATNFLLSASGGYLGLVEADGKTVASSYTFPAQYPDVSYGVTQPASPSEAPQTGFFQTATPGAPNGNRTNILLADRVTIAGASGLFAGSTTATLSGTTGTEHIRYVLAAPSGAGDAVSAPTATSPLYTGPIPITSTQLLRTAVFSADDSQRGLPSSAMYVQLDNTTSNRVDTFSSNLPLVVFDDNGFGLLPNDDTFYPGWIGAYSVGSNQTATLTQAPDFFIPASKKLHGFSSATWPKQSYESSLSDDLGQAVSKSFFGMDTDKKWDSISPWHIDLTFLHNAFVYSLARGMGYWAPSTTFAEMFIHSAGGPLDYTSYAGITILTDRIKVSSNRVNIYSLATTDVTAPNVTGGYILRFDHPETNSEYYTWTTTQGTTLMLDTPKQNVLVAAQAAYITGYVQQMENAMAADQASNYATRNYLNYLDRPSWVAYHLLNVFVENDDAFLYSEYFSKDVNGLIKAGPVWDYDRSMGSADGRDVNPLQWTPNGVGDFWNISWWKYVTHDPDFMQAWIDRWQTLRLSLFSDGNISGLVDSLATQLGPAAPARDTARWPANQSRFPGGWAGEVANMKAWLAARTQWIDAQFLAAPALSSSASSTVLTAPAGAQVVYTLDGSDPRLSGGAVSPSAIMATSSVTLAAGQAFAARSYQANLTGIYPGSPWSSQVTFAGNATGHFVNVSCRTQVGTGSDILVGGFVVSGRAGSATQVLVRGVGPTLGQYGVNGVLARPILSVYDSTGKLVATNTGWGTGANAALAQSTAATVGAFALPDDSADSALLLSLTPGAYSAQVAGVGQSTGIALVEAYLINQTNTQIVNISSRALVNSTTGPLITGFVISNGPAQVLVRGDGPALTQYGVTNALAQPVVQVFDSKGKLVATNTGWSTNSNADQIAAVASTVGAFPLASGSADSALLLTLPAGPYSIQISGAAGSSGDTLAECYLVPPGN
jgi:hypothetical protein